MSDVAPSRPQGVDSFGQPLQPGERPAGPVAAAPGPTITREEIMTRAESWLHPPVPYNMEVFKNDYRTDCSGYVSMAWKTNRNYWTGDLNTIGKLITYNDLRSGDMLLYHNSANPVNGSHVVLFHHWIGAVGGDFYIYEQTPPATKHRPWSMAGYNRSLYKPFQYANGHTAKYTVTAWHDANVRSTPYTKPDNIVSGVVAGESYPADCWTSGQLVDDQGYRNDVWIRLPLRAGGVGYVCAIYLKGDKFANIPEGAGHC
jgi:hypothetical protein